MSAHRGASRVGQLLAMVQLMSFLGGTGTAYAVPPISYQEVAVGKLVSSSGGEVLYRQVYYPGNVLNG
jgi:hypothetical protein